jgi:hypothetical protein
MGRVRAVYAASPQLARDREVHYSMPCAFGYDVVWEKLPGESYVLGIRLEVVPAPAAEPISSGVNSETGVQ